ncbi:MAG: class II fructose-bisphosphate aldolase [Pseudomonadota bacterium]
MSLATLKQVLQPALKDGYAVAGLVTLGWEDMRAYVAAAEALKAPLILQAGPGCRAHTPLPILGKMFRHLADQASVPVVAHLDHGYTREECEIALDCGFSSVMFDGSSMPLNQNIEETAAIAELAHGAGMSCEGEIGFVGYTEGASSQVTDPEDAAKFATETDVDAMAISVGNVHLQSEASGELDEARIREIERVTEVPLVIHGGSGVSLEQRRYLATQTNICKFNIGTELRKVFGSALRHLLEADEDLFDRVEILKQTHDPVMEAAKAAITSMRT